MEKIDNVDFEEDRYCPVFNRIIDCEWCYESLMGISKLAKKSAIKEFFCYIIICKNGQKNNRIFLRLFF